MTSKNNQIEQFYKPNDWETERSYFSDDWWYVRTLAKAPSLIIEVDLMSLDLAVNPWGMSTIADFISHSIVIRNCDFEHPIITSPDGWIMNGWHRVARAILEGKKTIKAQRILKLPEPDGKREV